MKMKFLSLALTLGLMFGAGVRAQDEAATPTANSTGAPEDLQASIAGAFFCSIVTNTAPTPSNKTNACYQACYAGTTPDVTDLGPCVAWLDANQNNSLFSKWLPALITAVKNKCNAIISPCTTAVCAASSTVTEACGAVCCNIKGAAGGVTNCLKYGGAKGKTTCAAYPDTTSVSAEIKNQPW